MVGSPQTLSVEDRRTVAAWAADCAERVVHLLGVESAADGRARAAIEQTRAFASGELAVGEALRRRGGDAGAAARQASTPAGRAAGYAAEQAAAVAHMGAHALGAAGYAVKAVVLDDGGDTSATIEAECRWQVSMMPPGVAAALRRLPLLGENRSGPLGPGRLSGGHVGEVIRALQSWLDDERCGTE